MECCFKVGCLLEEGVMMALLMERHVYIVYND